MLHRVVIVGYGTMGIAQRRKLDELRGVTVAGAVDIDPVRERYASEDGLRVYPDLKAALSDDSVDIALISTPNDSHRAIAESALRAGKHVICEKPAMMSSTDLKAVISLARASGLVFAIHQNRRWDEDYLAMKLLYDRQTLGPVHYIESRVHGSRGIPGDWRKEHARGGGMLLDWGVHLIDRLLAMVASPVVSVFGRLSYVLGNEVDDGFKAYLTFANGVEALIDVSTTSLIPAPKWRMEGLNGTATIDDWDMHGSILVHDRSREVDAVPVAAGAGMTKTMAPREVDYQALRANDPAVTFLPIPRVEVDTMQFYRNVLAAAEGLDPLIVSHDHAVRTMRLLEAIADSHRLHGVVAFEQPLRDSAAAS